VGRPKQYDRNELLDLAIDLFHRQGYEATTTAQLVTELGVNRKSMYAEFESKQKLFEAALERYDDKHLSGAIRAIETIDAGVDGIKRAFDSYARASGGWARGRGCLLANTAVERAAQDPSSGEYVDAYFERLNRAFGQTLENAVRQGDIDEGADRAALASFFTMSLVGVAVSARAQVPQAQIRAACDVIDQVLVANRPAAKSSELVECGKIIGNSSQRTCCCS
jgi:TetR/AcrR family transcriptional repressor of nem operon